MPGTKQVPGTKQCLELAGGPATAPLPVLFLMADTGGGHRNAARAVGESLELAYPGRFTPVLCDPLGGPGSARLLRWVTRLYGPAVRLAPWLWGAAYYATNARPAMWLLQRTLLRPAGRVAAGLGRVHRPAAIVSCHPLTGMAAVWARDQAAPLAPVVTVVTDLATMHAAWPYADADLIIAPPAVTGRHGPAGGHAGPSRRGKPARGAWAVAGPPVSREFGRGPLSAAQRARLRRSLGLAEGRLVVLLTGGGEGSGGMARRAAAILRRFTDVHVVVVRGRNTALKRRLDRLALRSGGRLDGDWLRGQHERLAAVLRPGRHQSRAGDHRGGRLLRYAPAADRAHPGAGEGEFRDRDQRGCRAPGAGRAAAGRRDRPASPGPRRHRRDGRGLRAPGPAGRRRAHGQADRRPDPGQRRRATRAVSCARL